MPGRTTYQVLLPIICFSFLAACAPDTSHDSDYPAPGNMMVLSVEPVSPDTTLPNLLPNGDFHEWYGGLSFPTGFDAPANRKVSTVRRDLMRGHLDTAGYTALQRWQSFDYLEAPEARFGTTAHLEPSRDYTFSVVAVASTDMVASIDAYTTNESGVTRLLAGNLVEVRGDEPRRYTGTFRTDETGTVSLRSRASPMVTLPGAVLWSSWELRQAPPAARLVTSADPDLRRFWIANSLTHVREQVALYGGVATWTENLGDLYENLDQINREAEEKPGNAILGYEQYAFRKEDLKYAQTVRDFVHTTSETELGYQPAYRALLQMDRALSARGIHLILVPLPDRIHLYMDTIYKPAVDLPPSYLPHTRLITSLLEQGTIALDVAPLLRHQRSQDAPVYWRTDFGVPSYTLGEVARYVQPILDEIDFARPKGGPSYVLAREESPLHQGALSELADVVRTQMAPETRIVHSVRDQANELFVPAERSPVLVVGSLARKHEESGASLAAQLSYGLGFPVSVLHAALEDQEILKHLIGANPPELESARVVLFCFPENALARAGW